MADPAPSNDTEPTSDLSWVKNPSYLSKYNLSGRVAVVTGGGSGIGYACAAALCSVGAHVVITGRTEQKLVAAVERLRKQQASVEYLVFDVSDPAAVRNAADNIGNRFGAVHVLVNNAGIAQPSTPVAELPDELFDRVVKTNLYGAHWCMQAFLPYIRKSSVGGSIVNIGSIAGNIVNDPERLASYNAAKAGLQHLSSSYAIELAEENIRFNTVAPGYIRTDMTKYLQTNSEMAKLCLSRVPMKRMEEPDEIAQTVLHLATDASSYVTGMTWIVDGGFCVP